MDRDGAEQLLVEFQAERQVGSAHDGNHRLEPFERLKRALEADRSRLDAVLRCGLGHVVNVGSAGEAFGVADGTDLTILH